MVFTKVGCPYCDLAKQASGQLIFASLPRLGKGRQQPFKVPPSGPGRVHTPDLIPDVARCSGDGRGVIPRLSKVCPGVLATAGSDTETEAALGER